MILKSIFLAPKPAFYHAVHDGPVVSMERSPFYKDILLSVGGWTLAVWKEGVAVSLY